MSIHHRSIGNIFLGVCALASGLACGQIKAKDFPATKNGGTVMQVHNDKRIIVVRSDANGSPRYCLEPVGPAVRLRSLDVTASAATDNGVNVRAAGEGKAKAGDSGSGSFEFAPYSRFEGEAGIRYAESLASVYSVTEIMQLAHATSYRLCEAYAGGEIQEKYRADMMKVFEETRRLILAQAILNLPKDASDARIRAVISVALTDQVGSLVEEDRRLAEEEERLMKEEIRVAALEDRHKAVKAKPEGKLDWAPYARLEPKQRTLAAEENLKESQRARAEIDGRLATLKERRKSVHSALEKAEAQLDVLSIPAPAPPPAPAPAPER